MRICRDFSSGKIVQTDSHDRKSERSRRSAEVSGVGENKGLARISHKPVERIAFKPQRGGITKPSRAAWAAVTKLYAKP
jgi:hypothetical protein